jgi:hypothetical protein
MIITYLSLAAKEVLINRRPEGIDRGLECRFEHWHALLAASRLHSGRVKLRDREDEEQ